MRMLTSAVLVSVSVLLFTPPLYADDDAGVKALSEQDKEKLKKELSALAQAFGVDVRTINQAAQEQSQQQTSTGRTAADVADRALDMAQGLVASISSTLQNVAPEVWRIMVRQQYAKAIADPMPSFLIIVICVIWHLAFKKTWMPPKREELSRQDYEITAFLRQFFNNVVPTIVGCISGVVLAFNVKDSVKLLVNPEFYAVRDLLVMLLNPTGAGG